MTSLKESLSGFAAPSIAFARLLGATARTRSQLPGEREQPEPAAWPEGSSELRFWREAYGAKGRPCQIQPKEDPASGATLASHETESFVLTASRPPQTRTQESGSTGTTSTTKTSLATTNLTIQPDRATSADATSTTTTKSATSASGTCADEFTLERMPSQTKEPRNRMAESMAKTRTSAKPKTSATKATQPSGAATVDVSKLSSAHHLAAATWSEEERKRCLEWAAEQDATAREMVAFRNVTQGQ